MKASDVFWALVVGVGAYLLWEWWQANPAPAASAPISAPTVPAQTAPVVSAPIFPSGGGSSQVVAVTTPTLPVQSFNEFGGVPVPVMYPGGNPSGPIMGGVVNLGSQS